MTNYEKLFGTPEMAAETLMDMCQSMVDCTHCPLYVAGLAFCDGGDYEGDVLEWLESEVRDG